MKKRVAIVGVLAFGLFVSAGPIGALAVGNIGPYDAGIVADDNTREYGIVNGNLCAGYINNDNLGECAAFQGGADLSYIFAAGNDFDSGTDSGGGFLVKFLVILLVPSIIAGIVCTIWKNQMKTAKVAKAARNYIPEGGFNLTARDDKFLYRSTTQTLISNNSSGGASSGSSMTSGRSTRI